MSESAPAGSEDARTAFWLRSGDPLAALVVGLSAATLVAAFLSTLAGRLYPEIGAIAAAAGVAAVVVGIVGTRRIAAVEPSGRSWIDWLAVAAFLAVSVRQFGWLVFERDGLLLTPLGNNLGDLPLHWTYVQHLARGAAFWPENPILTGDRLRYPLGVDLLSAVFVQLGASVPTVLRTAGLIGATLSALALRRWGGALAVAGLLFSGGLAGFELLRTGVLRDYQDAVAWKNLYLALFVPQRGFLLGLPAGLVLLWSWRRRLVRNAPGLPSWMEGIVWGALPLVHLHTFAMVSLLGAVWAVAGRRVRLLAPGFAWAVLPATWAVWQVTGGFGGTSLVGWKAGWMIGQAAPVWFLLVNFGVWLPLALATLAQAVYGRRCEELFLLAPAMAVFATLFVVRLAPWEWDNTKVMLWCYLLTLPAISRLLSSVRVAVRIVLVSLLLFSGAVSVLAASVRNDPRLEVLDAVEYAGVCEAVSVLGRDERVATVQTHNHPVALCGQPIVAGYSGHLWSHGLHARPIELDLARLLAGDPDWREIALRLRARYLFWGVREQAAFPVSRAPWATAGELVASGTWGALYRLY